MPTRPRDGTAITTCTCRSPPGGVNDPAEMQACLDYARALHKAGYRLPDPRDFHAPDRGFPVHQPPVMRTDWARQIRELAKGHS